jgi:hypothetical protein
MPTSEEAQAAGLAANKELWRWILAAGGAGMAGRAGLGLMRLMQPAPKYDPTPSFQQIGIAVPEAEEEEEDLLKDAAEEGGPSVIGKGYDWLTKLTEGLPWGKTHLFGRDTDNPYMNPALLAFGIPAAGVAGYGGWKAVDKVLDWRRKAELEAQHEKARQEYAELLKQTMPKRGADDAGLEAELDDLAELVTQPTEKQAETEAAPAPAPAATGMGAGSYYPSSLLSGATGALLGYAVLSSLMSGKLSYDHFKKRREREITEEALRRRRRERFGGMAPIYLKPSTEVV